MSSPTTFNTLIWQIHVLPASPYNLNHIFSLSQQNCWFSLPASLTETLNFSIACVKEGVLGNSVFYKTTTLSSQEVNAMKLKSWSNFTFNYIHNTAQQALLFISKIVII